VTLNNFYASQDYPGQLRRVRYKDPATEKSLVFLTNHFGIPASSVCALYKSRWQVELFFKWIKQHLRIKRFFGTSEKRREEPGVDRRRHLRAGGDCPQAAEAGFGVAYDVARLERHAF
jgi:Transposase DDE domain